MAKKKQSESGRSGAARVLVFGVVAVIAGLFSIFVLYTMISSYQAQIAEAKKPEDTVMVIVAARDLFTGISVTEEDLYAVEIPPRFLPENVFLSPEHVVGRIPRERILANEFIRADRLADPESGVGLNAVIPRGMRAMSVNISDGRALAGFLNPANYVDVIVTITPEDDTSKPLTLTQLQAVFVLGVNSRMGSENTDQAREKRGKQRPSVTLLVSGEQAEHLAYAEAMGDITLTLRNDLDRDYEDTQQVGLADLRRQLEHKPKARKRRPQPVDKPKGIKIIQGDQEDIGTR